MEPVRMGVIGCGAIAQVHHMPNLSEIQDLFQVSAVCDVSAGAAAYVAEKFHVPHHFTDYRDLLASDVEAVLLCQSDPKTQVAVDAFNAGKHVFIEKPMCFSVQEVDAIIDARKRSGKVGQVGYMKIFDPVYEYAKREVDGMKSIRFVQVNHLHPNNDLHVRQFDVRRFDDIPQERDRGDAGGALGRPERSDRRCACACGAGVSPAGGQHDSRSIRHAYYVWRAE